MGTCPTRGPGCRRLAWQFEAPGANAPIPLFTMVNLRCGAVGHRALFLAVSLTAQAQFAFGSSIMDPQAPSTAPTPALTPALTPAPTPAPTSSPTKAWDRIYGQDVGDDMCWRVFHDSTVGAENTVPAASPGSTTTCSRPPGWRSGTRSQHAHPGGLTPSCRSTTVG